MIALAVGSSNVINTVVTAQDGLTTQTYVITVTRQSGAQSWQTTWYGSTVSSNAAYTADPYHTGLSNLAVYAFFGPGKNPATALVSQLPQASLSGGNYTFSFTQPAGVSGVTYGAEWSSTLVSGSWTSITDTGSGTQHIFSVPVGSNTQLFMRLKVSSQ
jgi:hypothetical protein